MENGRHSTRGLGRCVHGLGHSLVHVVAMVYHVSVDRTVRHTTRVFVGDQAWLVLGHTDDAAAMDVAKRSCGRTVLVRVECSTDVAIGSFMYEQGLVVGDGKSFVGDVAAVRQGQQGCGGRVFPHGVLFGSLGARFESAMGG